MDGTLCKALYIGMDGALCKPLYIPMDRALCQGLGHLKGEKLMHFAKDYNALQANI